MGGGYGKEVLHLLAGLSRSQVCDIGMRKMKSMVIPSGANQHRPHIAVDCNNVIYHMGKQKGNPVAAIANFLEEWGNHGFVIIPMVDGDTPNAKQVLVNHIAKREKNRAKAVERRCELRRATALLSEESLTFDEREELSDTCKNLDKAIRTAKTQAMNCVSKGLWQLVGRGSSKISAHDINSSGGTVFHVQQAQFQAYSLLNQLFVDGKYVFIMSNSCDFPVHNGDGCIAVKVFSGPSITRLSTSQSTLDDAVLALCEKDNGLHKLQLAKTPLFEGIVDRRLWVILAVIIDSDACIRGVPDLGIGKVPAPRDTIKDTATDE